MPEAVVPNRGPQIDATAYTMLILATVAVALRFWSRHILTMAGFWWDDWVALMALPFIWVKCALTIYWVDVIGLGKHIEQAPDPSTDDAKLLFAVSVVYSTGLSLVKLSVLLLYIRIFKVVKLYQIGFWVTGLLIVGWCVATNFLAIFHCVPVRKLWTPDLKGHCLPMQPAFLGTAASNIIIDAVILILPMPMLWRIRIDLRQKLALIGVFAAGYCVIILSVLRLISIIKQDNSPPKDITWNLALGDIVITCEISVALISACLPSIFNLAKYGMKRYFPQFFPDLSGSNPHVGPGGENIGRVGNPLDDRKRKGFVQLPGKHFDTTTSIERLYDGPETTCHCATATSTSSDHKQKEGDPEMGIDLHEIHVREDMEIDVGRSM